MSAVAQETFAAALLDPLAPVPAGVTTARGAPDKLRFAVYRNNVMVGLTKSLAASFPVVQRLVGEDFFFAMARGYVEARRPDSPLMFRYGRGFPGFVESYAPAMSLPYLADVARIEAAWLAAYHARDCEPLGTAEIAAVPAERLAECRLVPHPAAALVSSAQPAGSIWQAHQQERVEPLRSWQAEAVLVCRPALVVTVTVLPAADAPFAAAVLAGATLGVAAEAALHDERFDFGRALTGLVGLGAFAAIADEGGWDE